MLKYFLFFVVLMLSACERDELVAEATPEKQLKASGSDNQSILKQLSGEIVFDSNRSGSFGIYAVKADGTGLRTIVDSKDHEMHPDVSGDGLKIVFAKTRSLERYAPAEVWIVDADGSNLKVLSADGTFPTFSKDGKKVFFERAAKSIFELNLDSREEREVFPANHKNFSNMIRTPRVSPDEQSVAFTSDKGGRWHAWRANILTGEMQVIGKGCEPEWYADSQRNIWVVASAAKAGSGVYERVGPGKAQAVADAEDPFGHEYFPSLIKGDKFLLYSACPGNQHSHEDSNYQLFVKDLSTGEKLRVLNDSFTNRWAKYRPIP